VARRLARRGGRARNAPEGHEDTWAHIVQIALAPTDGQSPGHEDKPMRSMILFAALTVLAIACAHQDATPDSATPADTPASTRSGGYPADTTVQSTGGSSGSGAQDGSSATKFADSTSGHANSAVSGPSAQPPADAGADSK
jgi:hypothetical protein